MFAPLCANAPEPLGAGQTAPPEALQVHAPSAMSAGVSVEIAPSVIGEPDTFVAMMVKLTSPLGAAVVGLTVLEIDSWGAADVVSGTLAWHAFVPTGVPALQTSPGAVVLTVAGIESVVENGAVVSTFALTSIV